MCLFRGTQITALLQGLLSMSSSPGTRIKPSVKNKYSVYSFIQNVTPPSKVLMHHLVLNTFPKAGNNSDKHQHLTIWGQASYCSDVLSEVGPFSSSQKGNKKTWSPPWLQVSILALPVWAKSSQEAGLGAWFHSHHGSIRHLCAASHHSLCWSPALQHIQEQVLVLI